MKSCRNCAHSKCWGHWQVSLYCPVIKKKVASAFSMSIDDNRKDDQKCRDLAARCPTYTPEELRNEDQDK